MKLNPTSRRLSEPFRRVQIAATRRFILVLSIWFSMAGDAGAAPFSDWQYRQEIQIASQGLVKIDLPVDTLDAAQPGLADLRVLDNTGNEVPYLIERPRPTGKVVRDAKQFQDSLTQDFTVIALETGFTEPIEGVTLTTPDGSFIKAVQVEGSADKKSWRPLATGQPIFRQSNGFSQLHVVVPTGAWPFLRLTVDNRRSPPVPFTGARIHAAAAEVVPSEPLKVRITDRIESPGETRLTLNFDAAGINLAELEIEAAAPLFTRKVTLVAQEMVENVVREKKLATAVIYRVAAEGQPAAAQLKFPLELQTPARKLLLLIQNDDSPPLQISVVRALRRPVYLIFLPRQSGTHSILTGNRRATAPRYDLASFESNLKAVTVSPLQLSSLAASPDYRATEALPEVSASGSALDVSAWVCRKRVPISRAGVQQLELDPEVLSHALSGFADLRLVRDGKQLPYILEPTSAIRALTPTATPATDPKKPKLSRWSIKLPHRSLPLLRLVCETRTPLFKRDALLYEEVADDRGQKYQRTLGQASWVQTPERKSRQLVLPLSGSTTSDTLFLEINNEDNPPIDLEKFELVYPVTRVLFKAALESPVYLYYGNHQAMPPRYDLSLVAAQMLAADKTAIFSGGEEQLKKSSWREQIPAGSGGVIFWAVLALVVVVLLFVISRLLPKSSPPPTA
jgi:hypothetical protein